MSTPVTVSRLHYLSNFGLATTLDCINKADMNMCVVVLLKMYLHIIAFAAHLNLLQERASDVTAGSFLCF